jgi:succinate dehydrogenase / fumarate reductase membrane anchor subunit
MSHKWDDSGMKTPLARARGLGASHDGVTHWWHQRVTSVSSFLLMLWLAWAVVTIPGWSYAEFTGWLAMPINAILMILAVISVFYHAALGSQVIVEDYIHVEWFKVAKLMGTQLFLIAAAVACIFSILKIAFAG